MSEASEIKVGSKAIFKVGRNVVTVEILRPMGDGKAFWVKNIASGKEFIMPGARLNVSTVSVEPVAEPAPETPSPAKEVVTETAAAPDPEALAETPAEPETEIEDNTPNPAPESGKPEKPTKNMSLMDAAVAALKEAGKPMNTREMVKAAIEKGYWIPTDCKTPEQTLYGSIFREMKTKEQPRIVKAEEKGKFQIA